MKKIAYTFVFTLIAFLGMAQNNQYLSKSDSDPAATKVLEALKADFKSLKSVKIVYTLKMATVQGEENMEGTIYQKGDKYAVVNKSQSVYNDGENVWIHLLDNNEVQIMDTDDEEGGLLTPESIMSMYEEENMVYAITDRPTFNGKKYTKIDFKPLDKSTQYLAMSIIVDPVSKTLYSMNIVSRDGGRYEMKVKETKKNINISDDYFTFDVSKYPDIYVEDLRLN